MRIEIAATGPVGIDTAWRRYARPALWPTWAPQIRSVDYPGEVLQENTRGWVHGPWPARLPFRVTEVEESARCWTWEIPLGLVRVQMTHLVEPAPDGTRTRLVLRGPAPLVLPYAPLAKIALRSLVR